MPQFIIKLLKGCYQTKFWKFSGLFAALIISVNGFSHLHLDGVYQGKNLYIQNPTEDDGVSFCVDSVTLNGDRMEIDIDQSAIEIPLESLGFTLGDSLHLVIYHQANCKPVVLNNLYHSASTIRIKNIRIDSTGLLEWETVTAAHCIYIVQQYKWHKWTNLDTLYSEIEAQNKTYSYQAQPHSGENKFRLKGSCRGTHCFQTLTRPHSILSSIQKVSYKVDKEEHTILFDAPTRYEIYNAYGERLKTGFGESVSLGEFTDRLYYLNYDNKTAKIRLKKRKHD